MQITVSAGVETSVPARQGMAADNQIRTSLVVCAATGTILYSWKAGDASAGIPLPSSGVAFNDIDSSAPLYLYSAAGGTVNYIEYPPRP